MAEPPAPGIKAGDTFEAAMLSPCVGGLVRTWSTAGSRLWSVSEPSTLVSVMGRGMVARTLREERRFREVGLLHEGTGTLLLNPRWPTATADGTLETTVSRVQLTDPGAPISSPWTDLTQWLGQAVRHTVEADGLLVVEQGGWDAPLEPYCIFLLTREPGELCVIETAPVPVGAELWKPSLRPGAPGVTISAPATDETLAVAPAIIVDACATWGLEPWDLAITYGSRS